MIDAAFQPLDDAARMLLVHPATMQNGFIQKVVICAVIGALGAGLVEFYRNFVTGADQALNGGHKSVHMHAQPVKK